ncbi:MAG: hypothetical protein P8J25_06535 [Porticoccaceae bacterium]|nr:hypothetical protein [Porticoccaceae bacterium]
MQQEVDKITLKRLIDITILLITYAFLLGAWIFIILAFGALFSAIRIYGISIVQIFLDLKLAFFGLFSHGLSSFALILASSFAKSNIKLFRITFILGVFFLTPAFFGIIYFLIHD